MDESRKTPILKQAQQTPSELTAFGAGVLSILRERGTDFRQTAGIVRSQVHSLISLSGISVVRILA